MENRPIVLETPRLVLCQLVYGDAPFILELLNDPSFLRHIGDKGVRNIEDAENYLRTGPLESYQRHGFGLYLTILRDDGRRIGICGLLKRDELDDPDVGFAFLPRYWSKGYACESAAAVLAYGWQELGMQRIIAIVSPENRSSIGLLRKIGLQFESRVQLGNETKQVDLYAVEIE